MAITTASDALTESMPENFSKEFEDFQNLERQELLTNYKAEQAKNITIVEPN